MPNVSPTKRELEVWELLTNSFNNSEISDILCIDYKTVECHISALISKTNKIRNGNFHPRTWLALNYHLSKYVGDLEHGKIMKCPACGAPGKFDVMTSGNKKNEAYFDDSIWNNRYEKKWECYDCWLK